MRSLLAVVLVASLSSCATFRTCPTIPVPPIPDPPVLTEEQDLALYEADPEAYNKLGEREDVKDAYRDRLLYLMEKHNRGCQ